MAEAKAIFVVAMAVATTDEVEHGKDLARRYRCEFVDLKNFHIQHELFRKIPVDLMFRYNFVPLEDKADGRLVIAIADPSQLMMIDEIGLLLGRRIATKVATLSQINDILKKTEQSQRVLEEASEGFALDVIAEDENSDETISIEKLTAKPTSARSSAWSTPPSSPRCSGEPAIFTSRRATTPWSSSTASTACCNRPCSPSPRSTTPPSSRVSRS